MPLEIALGSSKARVRGALLGRDQARAGPTGNVLCVVSPVSPPRLWAPVVEAVERAFLQSVGDGRGGTVALQRAAGAGAQGLARMHGALVEPHLNLDAQLVGFVALGDHAHMTISAGMRIYRARQGEPRRLLNSPQRAPGIARGGMLVSSESLLRGDLYVLGSRDAFGIRSIGAIATLLAQRPDAAAAELCEAALTPCRSLGLGVALAVVRAR